MNYFYLLMLQLIEFQCSGIGIVNAVEVLNAFPEEDGLQKFREWVESPDASILGKVNGQAGSTLRKRGSKGDADGNLAKEQNDSCSDFDNTQELKQYFMDKHVWSITDAWFISLLSITYFTIIVNLIIFLLCREMLARTGTFHLLFLVR